MTMFRRLLVFVAICAAAACVASTVFFFRPHRLLPVAPGATTLTGQALIERGHYLTVAGDCAACHTAPDRKPFAGGLPFKLPFGTIYSANITPDKTTGIGDWNEAEFVRAMREGVGKHGEDLYPAFPYTSYALLTDEDMLAIFAYLKTLTPVAEAPPENALSFPFNQRWTLRGWKLLYLASESFKPRADKSAEWNRGAYLVEGLAHCGECHTPRNLLFAREQSKILSGSEVDGWIAWNITPDIETGIGGWSESELERYLAAGHAEGHGAATGSMREAIDLSFSKLRSSDIQAMAAYLRTIPAIRNVDRGPVASSSRPSEAAGAWTAGLSSPEGPGRSLFAAACASCHAWNGEGQDTHRQALKGARDASDPMGRNLVRLILAGSTAPGDEPATAMPSFADSYTDSEIEAIANYVIAHFGGKEGQVTSEQVAAARKQVRSGE